MWEILHWKTTPYDSNFRPAMVLHGTRPLVSEAVREAAPELVELMIRMWDQTPQVRPTAEGALKVIKNIKVCSVTAKHSEPYISGQIIEDSSRQN
jgi:hypothetical protein